MNILQVLHEQKVISVRDFIYQLSSITKNPKSKIYTLTKNGKKVGTFIPEKFEDEVFANDMIEPTHDIRYHSLFDSYDEIAFTSGPKDLSTRIDEVLYGKKR